MYSKFEGKVQISSIYILLHSGTLVIIDEPALTCPSHTNFVIYSSIYSVSTFCGLGRTERTITKYQS